MARRTRAADIAANLAGWMTDTPAAENADTTPDPAAAEPAAAAEPGAPAAGAPARGSFAGGRRMVTAYLDAAEAAELEARAAAEERSVSFLVRRAVRAYLGMK